MNSKGPAQDSRTPLPNVPGKDHSLLTTHHSPLAILQSYWNYHSFRPLQEEIIQSILSGKDTLALLPTGGGKSICYQVPALVKPGLCLVISPLIALMKDQVEQLRKRHITAFAIFSGMSRKEVINTLKVAAESNCKFLYVSPERLETTVFLEYLPSLPINLIAVDEAHCISQWGYDFRPPYLRIANLRKELPGIPLLALTASATPAVQEDIVEKLQFGDKNIFRQSFERPNLSYSVFRVDSKINKIIEILQKVPGSSLVYCKSRKRTQEFSNLLRMHQINADYYHAGLSQEERNRKQESWIGNEIRCMVCTNAFGMGIDKADVRVVIHADVPECLENYYQEAGRAGRDGKKSYAVLLYHEKEIAELKNQHILRFPALSSIREIYQALMNYLQLPIASGEGNYYDFDIVEFVKKFKLEAPLVWSALKVLEHEDTISYSEQLFIPSQVQFVTNKDLLYEFESTHPQLEPLIKALLRTYEGIFDYPAKIHEKTLAALLKTDISGIKNQLRQLHAFRIIRYEEQKDKPQIFFPRNRVGSEELTINQHHYERRKKEFVSRVGAMVEYIANQKNCRSKLIASYFGDKDLKDCGVCDNCLSAKRATIDGNEFRKITGMIEEVLSAQPTSINSLINHLKSIHPEKIMRIISYLQAENRIDANEEGILTLNSQGIL
jgi:ATP-dependent DNA helicase RecQ